MSPTSSRPLASAFAFATLLSALAVAGCGHTPAAGESIAEVCKKENDGKQLSVSGYLTVPKMLTFCSPKCTMHLAPAKVEKDVSLSTAFAVGDGPGEINKLPDTFTAADVDVRDSAGKRFGAGAPVRLTGKVSVSDGLCSMFAPEKIEAL